MSDYVADMVNSGLEGVVAATTRLSHVDGERGELVIAGYPVGELAEHATFEETTWLLWHGELPSARAARGVPRRARGRARRCRRRRSRCCATARAPASIRWTRCASPPARSRSTSDDAGRDRRAVPDDRRRLLAAAARAEPLAPRRDLGHAANFLYMLSGDVPGSPSASAGSRPTSTPSSITASTPRRSPRA